MPRAVAVLVPVPVHAVVSAAHKSNTAVGHICVDIPPRSLRAKQSRHSNHRLAGIVPVVSRQSPVGSHQSAVASRRQSQVTSRQSPEMHATKESGCTIRTYFHHAVVQAFRPAVGDLLMKILTFIAVSLALALSLGIARPRAAGCDPVGQIRFVCDQAGPEDLVAVPGSPWIIASAYGAAGGLHLIDTKAATSTRLFPSATATERLDAKTYDSCPGPLEGTDRERFRTHGLYLKPGRNSTHTLYVVHHGNRESIEIFELDPRSIQGAIQRANQPPKQPAVPGSDVPWRRTRSA